MKRFLFTLTMLLLSLLVVAPQGFPHEPQVHQYMVKQAYYFLDWEKGPIPELRDRIGLDIYGYGSDDDPWYFGLIGVGAWREDLEDPIWGYGGPFNGWTPTSTHFWDPDAGDDNPTPIPLSPDAPNAYYKARVYLFGGHNIFIQQNTIDPYVGHIFGRFYSYNSLVDFYRTGRCYYEGYIDLGGDIHYLPPSELYMNLETARRYAVLILGRVAHLLGDMSVPAHTHNDLHPWWESDVYEGWMPSYYTLWPWTNAMQQGPLLDAYRAAPSGDARRIIRYLFYTAAQIANRFPSNDSNGDERYRTSYREDDYSVLNMIQEITHPFNGYLDPIMVSDYAFRYGIRAVADLLYWFATETGMLKKTTIRNDFDAGQININGHAYPSGYILGLNLGTPITLNAVSPQTIDGRVFYFDHWQKRDSAGIVVATNPSPSWTITIDGDCTYVAVSQAMDASISGPDLMHLGEAATFTAVVTGGIGPITFEWRWREPPGLWGPVIGRDQTHTHFMGHTDFELQVKVTGTEGEIYRTKHVTFSAGSVGGGGIGGGSGSGGNLDVAINGPTTLAQGQTGNFNADVPPNCCTRFEWRWRYMGDPDWSTIVGTARTYSHTMGTRDIELKLEVFKRFDTVTLSGWGTLTVVRSGGQGPVQPKVPSSLVSKEAQGAK